MAFGITGASGQLGRDAAARLLDVVDPAEIVLTSRTADSLREFAARGVDVRAADFGKPSSLTAAFDGIDRLLLISTDRVGDRLAGHLAAIEAAATAGVPLTSPVQLGASHLSAVVGSEDSRAGDQRRH